jgi:hypothetical protein
MINTNTLNVGHQEMRMDLPGMQEACGYIANSQTRGFPIIKSGLDAIQSLADFLKASSENEKIGYLSQLKSVETSVRSLKQVFIQAVFIRTKGMVDLEAENIMKPSTDKTIRSVELSLKMNMLGKMVLLDLNRSIVQPIAETLGEIKAAVLAHVQRGVQIDEEEKKLYEHLEDDASAKSRFEIDCREGSHISGFGTNKNLKNALIAEAQQIRKPKEMDPAEYRTLLSVLDGVKKQRDLEYVFKFEI